MTQESVQKISDLYQAAQALYKAEQFHDAAKLCLSILKQDRNNATVTDFLGIILHRLHKPRLSRNMLARANQLSPNNPSYLNNQASVLTDQNQLEQAEAVYLQALKIKPDFKDAAINLAKLYSKQNNHAKSFDILEKIAQFYPNDSHLIYTQGKLLTNSGQYNKADDYLKRALAIDPNLPFIYFYLGITQYNLKHFADCINYFQTHTNKHPEHFLGWIYFANSLNKLKKRKFRVEINCYRKAIALEPNNPIGYYNLANSLTSAGRYNLAEKVLKKVLEKEPNMLNAYISYGYLEYLRCHLDHALELHQQALKINPNAVVAHTNLSLIYLLQGRFAQGWKEYEHRWQHQDLADIRDNFSGNRWLGEPLDDKKLLIFTEQGYGDVIQFVRYIPMIKKGTGKIIIECREALMPLIKTVPNVDKVVIRKKPFPKHDYYIPLLSLPGFFNTSLKSIPCDIPYLSIKRPQKNKWKKILEPYCDNFKIGIAWSGSITHRDDKTRSIKPSLFANLKLDKHIKLFVLQKDIDPKLCERYNFINLDSYLNDFSDTGACIEELDLVISVDTAVLHLAGALGQPAWALLAYRPDWRWLLNRSDSPWYPSLRLFRQPKLQDWQSVITQVAQELKTLITAQK